MGPHERRALESRFAELLNKPGKLSPWEGKEMDEIADELTRDDYNKRKAGGAPLAGDSK